MVQVEREPDDDQPVPRIGRGAYEIRIRNEAGAFRVMDVAKFTHVVYVLHAFQKTTRKTAKAEIDLAASRDRLIREES